MSTMAHDPISPASVVTMLSHSDDLSLANLVSDNDDDEEEEIELRQSKRDAYAHFGNTSSSSIHCPSSSSSPSPVRTAAPSRIQTESSHRRFGDREQQPHGLRLPTSPTAPLRERLNSVISATSQVANHFDIVADSVAEAMSLLQHPFGGSGSQSHSQAPPRQHLDQKARETYNINPKLEEARDLQVRLKLQALWQLLLTGFEVLKFSIGKRMRKRILWVALDGKLYLTATKNDRNPNNCIFLADIYKVQKGSEAQSFTKSQSYRDARGSNGQRCFSIHGSCARREKTFALQVATASVRNVVAENLLALLQRVKSDADGEFPSVAQRVIAQQYAATGDVIALRQVEDILLREEDEKKSGGSNNNNGNAVAVATAKEASPNRKMSSRISATWSAAAKPNTLRSANSGGEDEDEDDDMDELNRTTQRRDILG